MEWLDPLVRIVLFLWSPVSRQIGYIKNVIDNLDALRRETDELRRMRDGVQSQVDHAASSGKIPAPLVQNWLANADSTIAQVDSINSQQLERCCCTALISRRKLGKRAIKMTNDVKDVKGKENFEEVATSPLRSGMRRDKMPVPKELEEQRTSQEALEEISQWLQDEDVGVICVWGMGGVGKTTLVKEIYNRVQATTGFAKVIWVNVSKDVDLEVIGKRIGNKLDMEFHGNEDTEDKRGRLHARLSNIRYMLILDDLWQEFSLDQVGIPQPNNENGCKIVITTRLNEVSNGMEADRKVKIKPLGSEDAWNLFCSKAGDVIRSPELRPVAEKVAEECGGLPLAIITVGRAMRDKHKKELWQHALTALKGSAPEIRGMESQVFLPLKLSYDSLQNSKIQSCFLYCCLYPEDYEIDVEGLVSDWAFEEELVNNVNSLDDAFNKGHDILEKLIDACLLEKQGSDTIKMHDLVRDLAIWITSPSSSPHSQASKFLVKAGEGLEQPPPEKLWEGVERISLMGNQIAELQMVPACPDLVFLCLGQNQKLHSIHNSFFQLMPKLQVLHLWGTGIKSLPPSLSQLVNLHVLAVSGCENLEEVPPLGELKQLRALFLSFSGIKNLPQGMESLAKLKYLHLEHKNSLAAIPSNIISRLTSLEHLSLSVKRRETILDTWREVATLPRLTSLEILFPSFNVYIAANIVENPIWSRMSRFFVRFASDEEGDAPRDPRLKKEVRIIGCQDFPSQINSNSMMQKTEGLLVKQSQGLESFSQIIGNSTCLKFINLEEVEGVKCVADWSKAGESDALESLEEVFLWRLPCLEKIFNGVPPTGFQRLRDVSIGDCPKLTCIFSSSMLQFLYQLEELAVRNCQEVEEIVEKGGQLSNTTTVLQKLHSLRLRGLPKFTAIWSPRLVLTSLKFIQMSDCPKLKKLPVLCSRIREINGYIRASREEWEGIEWEDEHSKSIYSTIY